MTYIIPQRSKMVNVDVAKWITGQNDDSLWGDEHTESSGIYSQNRYSAEYFRKSEDLCYMGVAVCIEDKRIK